MDGVVAARISWSRDAIQGWTDEFVTDGNLAERDKAAASHATDFDAYRFA